MPELAVFSAFVLAAVFTTGALLDKLKVRRSRRVLVWVGLFLILPVSVLALLMYILSSYNWHSC